MSCHYTANNLDCFWLLDSLLKYATTPGAMPPFTASEKTRPPPLDLPRHMEGECDAQRSTVVHILLPSYNYRLQAIDFIVTRTCWMPVTQHNSELFPLVQNYTGSCHAHLTQPIQGVFSEFLPHHWRVPVMDPVGT